MTEREARTILENYREVDEDTGEEHKYIIRYCAGNDANAFFFECKIEGYEYQQGVILPMIAVYSDGRILSLLLYPYPP